MYIVYLFKEKRTDKIIYVGSSARPAARMKEHKQALLGLKKRSKIHRYMLQNNLEFYRDIEVIWVDYGNTREEMIKLEEKYYYKYVDNGLLNERPGENRYGWYNPKRKAIRCINDGKIFKTITECALYYRKARQTIQDIVTSRKSYTWINSEKYYFEYVDKKCND